VTSVEDPTVLVVQDPPAPKIVEVQALGPQGRAGSVTVGTVSTGEEGTDAEVTNVGTPYAAVLNFVIPRGNTGGDGQAATITVGTVSTGAPGSDVTFTNVGTANAAIFNISIPRGNTGAAGSSAWGSITGTPTTLGGYGITDAYANPMTTAGDLTIGGAGGAPARLAKGANGNHLTVAAGALTWSDFVADVRSVVLVGLSLATGTAITAADTVLTALGKLQKQASDLFTSKASASGGNLLINGNFAVNQRAYVSGAATSTANQYTLDRWRVVTSGQNLAFAAAGNGNSVTAPAGGIEQVIEGASIGVATHVISWAGTATCTVDGTAKASGATVTLVPGTNATVKFTGGTVSQAQLTPGSVATAFEFLSASVERALCQRYFEVGRFDLFGYVISGEALGGTAYYRVSKRVTPTIVITAQTGTNVGSATANTAVGGVESVRFTAIGTASARADMSVNYTASAEL
jgi:hypothetical protein